MRLARNSLGVAVGRPRWRLPRAPRPPARFCLPHRADDVGQAPSASTATSCTVTLRDGGDASFDRPPWSRASTPTKWPTPVAVAAATAAPRSRRGPVAPQACWPAGPFAALIETAAGDHGVDERLVHAVIQAESNYQPRARSRAGAKGLMQVMPATARQYRACGTSYDPQANLEAGVRYLKDLLGRFDAGAGAGRLQRRRGCRPNLRRDATFCRNAQTTWRECSSASGR